MPKLEKAFHDAIVTANPMVAKVKTFRTTSPAAPPGAEPWGSRPIRKLLPGLALAAITLAAYLPVIWWGGFIWDDPDYVINNMTLRTLEGLLRMWTDPHALPQYYPLVHTTFWMEYQLWGLNPLGYHLVNVLLHAASALVLWRLLVRLGLPGAWLAAAIFAVHPVHVESVAWITERKNVLSGLLYLLSLGLFLRAVRVTRAPDPAPEGTAPAARSEIAAAAVPFAPLAPVWGAYACALVLFVGALLSKTVTASLPAAVLLLIWWKRGRIRPIEIAWTIPFFAVGLVLAMQTAHLEQVRVGAMGQEWQYGASPLSELLARTIIAGRALWFYAWKLAWPVNLAFIYERWEINWRDPLQYAYPAMAIVIIVALFALRRRIGRGPVVGVLFFTGTLFPALGFFNVFPHRYAFVADHFQYHASIGLIVLAAALLARATARFPLPLRAVLSGLLLFPLAVRANAQSQLYQSPITLWDDTVRKSPRNWMAWTNLGNALVAEKRIEEAIPLYEHALTLAPHVDDVQWNAGVARARQGRYREAEHHFRRTVEIKPTYVPAWEALGDLYADELDDPHSAVAAYTRALEIAPHRTATRRKLLEVLLKLDPGNEQARELLRRLER
jgi:protein O-mannosyl-transferase